MLNTSPFSNRLRQWAAAALLLAVSASCGILVFATDVAAEERGGFLGASATLGVGSPVGYAGAGVTLGPPVLSLEFSAGLGKSSPQIAMMLRPGIPVDRLTVLGVGVGVSHGDYEGGVYTDLAESFGNSLGDALVPGEQAYYDYKWLGVTWLNVEVFMAAVQKGYGRFAIGLGIPVDRGTCQATPRGAGEARACNAMLPLSFGALMYVSGTLGFYLL